ncbi:MAG: NUDIX domain-containing protein [Thermoleophilia bacterium]|nr:NUDIX domain-containing protein [Thermoleophilia bacterium]
METTWDGLPVAQDKPMAVAVVVRRGSPPRTEYLLLHRAHEGPAYEGDWAWTTPAGARRPGEEPRRAAERELTEETGLRLPIAGPLEHVTDDVALFVAEAPADAEVRLDAEHDRFEWVTLEEGVRRCLPAVVGESLRIADAAPQAAG